MSRELKSGDPKRIHGAVAAYMSSWPPGAREDFELLVALAEKGIGAGALIKLLEDNLGSIDAERTALSPYARGALGAIRAALKVALEPKVEELEPGPYHKDFDADEMMKRRRARQQDAAIGRLAEWEEAFPGAEASEVLSSLGEERRENAALLLAAGEFLDNLHHPQIGEQSRLEGNLRALVNAAKKAEPRHVEEIETTL